MKEDRLNKIQTMGIEHLEEAQMTYIHHCRHGLYYSLKLLMLACSSAIHAVIPGVLKFHAAKGVIDIYNEISKLTHIAKFLKKDNTNAKL